MSGERRMDGPKLGDPRRLENGVWWFGYRHARDIPSSLFLDAIQVASVERAQRMGWPRALDAHRWDVAAVLATGHITDDLDAPTPGVPPKVVLAKARRLVNQKVIEGCCCGCRGDFRKTRVTQA